jgi:hypothetical protein
MAISQSLKNSLPSITRSTEDATELADLLGQIGVAPAGPLISSSRKTSSQTAAGGYSLVPITFDISDVNDQNRMNTSGVYSVLDTGLYEIIGIVHLTGITPTQEGNILVISTLLGDSIAGTKIPSGNLNGVATVTFHAIQNLSAGDTLTVVSRSSEAQIIRDSLYGAGDASHFTVKKLR